MEIEKYNRKGFLLPDSIDSMAGFHAKLFATGPHRGEYIFRIHDCITGIRLRGQLESINDFDDAIEKMERLASALLSFSGHLEKLKSLNLKQIKDTEEKNSQGFLIGDPLH